MTIEILNGMFLIISTTPMHVGMFFVLPCMDDFTKVDLRTICFDVPPQEILTKDSVSVAVDAIIYYKIANPVMSVTNVENCK